MSEGFASDRKRVEGLGGGRHGAGTWIKERVTSIALVPLGVWGLWSATRVMGTGYDGAVAWLKQPLNAVLMALLLCSALWHMQLGLRNVVEDYVHKPFGKAALLLLNLFVCLLLGAAGLFSILKVAFGARIGV